MKTDLKVDLCGIKLKNPLLTASGTFGYGHELKDLISLKKLGAIITKTLTLEPRAGNPAPRIAEVENGLINSVGLQNIGIKAFIKTQLSELKKIDVPIIISIAGQTPNDYLEIAQMLNRQKGISALELNLSCPNLKKQIICHNKSLMKEIVSQVKKISAFPVIAKLSPLTADIAALSLAAQNAGADALTLANTYPAMAIDIKTFKPKLAAIKGGLSGPCIKPLALRCVYDAYKKVSIPIIGCGGIMTGADAIEFMLAGAACISAGTVGLISPKALIKIVDDIDLILRAKNIKSLKDLRACFKETL